MTTTLTRTEPPAPPQTPVRRPVARRRPRREWPFRTIVLALLLLGIVVTLWPVGATFYNNWRTYQFAESHDAGGTKVPDHIAKQQLAAAHRYNAALQPGPVTDPWAKNHPSDADRSDDPAWKEYRSQLDATDAMAALRIPSLKVELPVFHGTDDWALARGAGHVFGTSLPVGGKGTHTALSAHRGLPALTAFDNLPSLKVGDQFFIDVMGKTLAYEVSSLKTVDPHDMSGLGRIAGKDLVTLVTCTPYGINTYRLLVTGHRIPWSQVDQKAAAWHGFDWQIQQWMWIRIATALLILAAALAIIRKWVREDRRRKRRLEARRAAAAAARGAAPAAAAEAQVTDPNVGNVEHVDGAAGDNDAGGTSGTPSDTPSGPNPKPGTTSHEKEER